MKKKNSAPYQKTTHRLPPSPLTEIINSQRQPPRDTPLHALRGGSSVQDRLNTRHLPFSRLVPARVGIFLAAPTDETLVMRISLTE